MRKNGTMPYLRPDGKSQVTVEYDANHKPIRVDAIVISSQHDDVVENDTLRADVIEHVIEAVIPPELLDENTKYHINPTGRFVIGGPMGDSGLTGRKIIVDTYGGMGRHGGGAFSGKDATKVDRSAAYMARYIAKNIVAAGLADRAKCSLPTPSASPSLSACWSKPSAPARSTSRSLTDLVRKNFSLTPKGIIETSTCASRSSSRPPPMATSAAPARLHLGKDRQGRGFEGRSSAGSRRNKVVSGTSKRMGSQGGCPFFF